MFDLSGNALTASVPGTTQFYQAEYFVGGRDWGTLATGGVNFRYPDWVGNGRVWQNVAGTVTQQAAYAAFGDGLFAPGGGSCCSLGAGMFDGAWQDCGNNTYHTLNREYSPTQGRWLTPDPAGLAAIDPTNPQTWNRYAYVMNNPVSHRDPTGLKCDDDGGCDGDGGSGGGGYAGGAAGLSDGEIQVLYDTGDNPYADVSSQTGYNGDDSVATFYSQSIANPGQSPTVDESSVLGGRPAWDSQVNGFTQMTVDIAIVSISFTQDHFHNRFLSLGLGVGAAPFSFSVANGWFNGKPNATSQTSCNTHSGLSFTGGAGLLFGGAESYTPSNGQWTTQMGVFSPQAGVGFSYGFPIQGSCGGG